MKISELRDIDSSIKILSGKDDIELTSISNSDNPQSHSIIFVKGKKFLNNLGKKSQSENFLDVSLFIQEKFWDELNDQDQKDLETKFACVCSVQNVDRSMSILSKPFYDNKVAGLNFQVDGRQMDTCQISPDAEIAQNVFIGENVKIGAGTIIMPGCNILPEVEIGENNIIYPNVTIYPFTKIGNQCRIHAGTVIGSDGFGYNFFDGKHQKVWHFSGVIIADDVEIGCNTMIDAGAFTPTEIGNGTKIDNDVQIAHNVKVGEHVIICGKTGLAGSVEVKNYCAFGAGSGVAPSSVLEEGVQVAARAIVSENAVVPKGSVVAGHPARPLKEWLRGQAAVRKLTKK